MEYKLTINGMKCEGCVNRINNVLSTIKGVESFNVSLETKALTIKVKKEQKHQLWSFQPSKLQNISKEQLWEMKMPLYTLLLK